MTDTPFPTTDIFTTLGIDPNLQYIPVRAVLRTLGLAPTSYEKALRRIPVLAAGLKPLWITDAQGNRMPALCLRVDLLPLWLCTLPAGSQPLLSQWQHEAASILWQTGKPNGAAPTDTLVPNAHTQSAVEIAYTQVSEAAALARHQLLAERAVDQLVRDSDQPQLAQLPDTNAEALMRAIRQTALVSATLSKRNDYLGMFIGLVRVFQITALRQIPPARLDAALEWLSHWRNDLESDHTADEA